MAKKKTGTVRTTISIPGELKRRMGEVTKPVNWSSVAAQAFESQLAAIAAQNKEEVMSSVLERLRASKRREETEDYKTGYASGKRWAEQSAEASELQRLEELRDEHEAQSLDDWHDCFDLQEGEVYGTEEWLHAAMHPEAEKDPRAVEDFWKYTVGDSIQVAANGGAFLRGFAEGAIDLWLSVKDEL